MEAIQHRACRRKCRNLGLDRRHGDGLRFRQLLTVRRQQVAQLACRWRDAGASQSRLLAAPTPCRPFSDDPQTALEATSSQTTPEFGAVVATCFPLGAELDEVSLQRV